RSSVFPVEPASLEPGRQAVGRTAQCSTAMVRRWAMPSYSAANSDARARLLVEKLIWTRSASEDGQPVTARLPPSASDRSRTPGAPTRSFFASYNHKHRHSGIGYHTPGSVHYGTAVEVRAKQAESLNATYGGAPASAGPLGRPLPCDLAGDDVQPVPGVDRRDGDHQRGESRPVVVLGRLLEDLVRHGIGPVGKAGSGFGQRQGGPLGVTEVGSLPPRRQREKALVGLTGLLGGPGVHIEANRAPVDLAG